MDFTRVFSNSLIASPEVQKLLDAKPVGMEKSEMLGKIQSEIFVLFSFENDLNENMDMFLVPKEVENLEKQANLSVSENGPLNLTVSMAYALMMATPIWDLIEETYDGLQSSGVLPSTKLLESKETVIPNMRIENRGIFNKAYLILKYVEQEGKLTILHKLQNKAYKFSYNLFKSGVVDFLAVGSRFAKKDLSHLQTNLELVSYLYSYGHSKHKETRLFTLHYFDLCALTSVPKYPDSYFTVKTLKLSDFWWFYEDSATLEEYILGETPITYKAIAMETDKANSGDHTAFSSVFFRRRSRLVFSSVQGDFRAYLTSLRYATNLGVDILNVVITRERVVELLIYIQGMYKKIKKEDIPFKEAVIYLFSILLVENLIGKPDNSTALQLASSITAMNKKQEGVSDSTEAEDTIDTLKAKLEDSHRRFQEYDKVMQTKIAKITEDNARLEKANMNLQEELSEVESLKRELSALRSKVYSMANEGEEATVSIEEMKRVIATKKILVIGGHFSWVNKLKNVFPTLEFIDVLSGKNRSMERVNTYDYVFVYTKYMNHTGYNKLMSVLTTNLRYLNKHVNPDLTAQEIYNGIKT